MYLNLGLERVDLTGEGLDLQVQVLNEGQKILLLGVLALSLHLIGVARRHMSNLPFPSSFKVVLHLELLVLLLAVLTGTLHLRLHLGNLRLATVEGASSTSNSTCL